MEKKFEQGGGGGGSSSNNPFVEKPVKGSGGGGGQKSPRQDRGGSGAENNLLQEQIKRLKLLVQQRDNELMILLNLVNKHKSGVGGGGGDSVSSEIYIPVKRDDGQLVEESKQEFVSPLKVIQQNTPDVVPKPATYNNFIGKPNQSDTSSLSGYETAVTTKLGVQQGPLGMGRENSMMSSNNVVTSNLNDVSNLLLHPLNLTHDQLMDRANCFELFRKSYRKNEAMEENQLILKEKINEAKNLGIIINQARSDVDRLKNQIQALRKEIAVQGLINGQSEDAKHPEEERLTKQIQNQQRIYQENYDKLKDFKAEIESIQALLVQNNQRLQQDFQRWLQVMMNQRQIILPTNNASITSNPSMNNDLHQDKEVEKKLQAFYKARDEIYKNSN